MNTSTTPITHFNRYDSMPMTTLRSINECITALYDIDSTHSRFTLSNYLYGLFDGFDYSHLIPSCKFMEDIATQAPALHLTILTICDEVSKYPRSPEQEH